MKAAVVLFSLIALGQPPGSWELATSRLALTSLGPVKIGMSKAAVRKAVRADLIDGPGGTDACAQAYVAQDPGFVFMFEQDRLTRIDLADAHHETVRRLRIGDTDARARALYAGQYELRPHKYLKEGRYLIVRSRDRQHALVVVTDGRFVTGLHAGRLPAAEYVEGCS